MYYFKRLYTKQNDAETSKLQLFKYTFNTKKEGGEEIMMGKFQIDEIDYHNDTVLQQHHVMFSKMFGEEKDELHHI